MQSKNVILSVDRLLRHLMGTHTPSGILIPHSKPFGGKYFLFGGDFRQNAPVLPKQNRADAVNIKMSLVVNCFKH